METDNSLQSSQFPTTHLHTQHNHKYTTITFVKDTHSNKVSTNKHIFQDISSLQISKQNFGMFLCISRFVPRRTRNAKFEGRQLDTGSAQYCRSSCCRYG